MDKIIVEDLELECRIGWTEIERSEPQKLLLVLELLLDLRPAAETKQLSATVCYVELADALLNFVQSRTWVLLEELADKVAEFVRSTQPLVTEVKVQVKKFVLPQAKWVAVEISR